MDQQTQLTGSDSFKSLEEKLATPRDIEPLIRPYVEGTSSGSGDDDDKPLKTQYSAPSKPWKWFEADVFIIPNDPLPKKSKNSPVPPLDLHTTQRSLELTNQDRREKIRENFGKKFAQESEKEEKIGAAIALLQQQTPDSTRPRGSSLGTPFSLSTTRQNRSLSHETILPRSPSNPLNIASKTPQNSLSQEQSSGMSPQTSPRKTRTEFSPETVLPPIASPESKNEIPQIPVTPPKTPSPIPTPPSSPRTPTPENPINTLKTSKQSTIPQEKKDDTKINNTPQETNPTSMRPLTWKDGGTALFTIAGLLSLLYYLDKLPAALTAKIDLILATLNMNR